MWKTILRTFLFVGMICSSTWASPSAQDILKASGVEGGLIVQIGCSDGKHVAALRADESFLVQGLDTNPAHIESARAHIRSLGLGGVVTIDPFDGERLPYANNLVSLVVSENLGKVPMTEVTRALSPGGVAYIKTGGAWKKTVKPWPAEIDDWTHYLHGPDNNAVAQDTVVGPPRHFQWIGGPRFSRSHDHLASVSAMVSAGGRLYYIVDEGSIAFAGASPKWRLVARNAFNGIVLWKRDITTWEYHLRDFRSGPADIARRLVAVGDRVYTTLGYGQPVVALDGATGETIRTYAGTEETREILHYDGMLLLARGTPDKNWRYQEAKKIVSKPGYSPPFERTSPPAHQLRVTAMNADTGERIWENSTPSTEEMMPSTLAADAGRVYFQNVEAVICLDAKTGKLLWRAPRPIQRKRLAWSTPTVVVYDGVVFSADRGANDTESDTLWMPSGGYHEYIRDDDAAGEMIAFDAESGDFLWKCPAYEGFNSPVDVMIADGLVWSGRYGWGQDPGITQGRVPKPARCVESVRAIRSL